MELPPYEQISQCDPLPNYSPSIHLTGRLLCKHKLVTPDSPAFPRHWRRVDAELQGTTLLLFEILGPTSTSHFCSYTLQAGDAGLATDYKNRYDVFRARVEGEQLLFIAPRVEVAMMWVESLLMVIAISEPLDIRKMPRYPSIPSRGVESEAVGTATWFGRRLWTELARNARHQREWLLERPERCRMERWRDVVSGQNDELLRCRSESSEIEPKLEPSSNYLSRLMSQSCQCPHSSCWGKTARRDPTDKELLHNVENVANDAWWLSSLGQSVRSTRTLTKHSDWNSVYYVKDGRQIKIPCRPA